MGQQTTKCDDDETMETDEDKSKPEPRTTYTPLSARQVKNRSGSYVWEVNDMTKLQRFLFLSSESAFSYKAGVAEPRREDVQCIYRLISDGKGKEVVELLKGVSLAGRAPKQHPTLFALAVCARSQDPETKKAAYEVVNETCRIPTHLFLFVKYCEQNSSGTGWGRAHKRAINKWYENKALNPKALARLVTKCKGSEGWSHKDIFRLAHPKSTESKAKMEKIDDMETEYSPVLDIIISFVVRGFEEAEKLWQEMGAQGEDINMMMEYLRATEEARRCTDEDRMVELISGYGLEREHLTTQLLNSKKVWEALVKTMQMTAIIRNLGKISSMDLCSEGSRIEVEICKKLANVTLLKKARIHPFQVLVALTTYNKGRGDRGGLCWEPNNNIVKALDEAFYLSFQAVEPTEKRYLLAIDVSGSMNVPCVGSQTVTCRDAAAAMMMVTARTESKYDVVAFSHKLTPINIGQNDKLEQVQNKFEEVAFGPTDCALPMIWAKEQNKAYDVFIVYTDIETWYDKVHPARALQEYRNRMNIPDAKLVVVGLASNGFSIADPDDFGMLDVIGFDFGSMNTVRKFIVGEL